MTCSHCGADNPAGKKFCGDCGGALENRCPHCGADNPANKKFCGDCGSTLVAQPARSADKAEARKVVTIVFADLIGSTSLHERLDAESTRRLMDRYYRALRGAVETHGGTVVKLMGDGVMAAFGVPHVAEDDAIRAVRAGLAIQQAFRTLADEQAAAVGQLGLRVGINTGEVVVSADNTDVVGDPANVAARLQQEARDGEVLIGESTRRLVNERVTLTPAGVFSLKGRAETVAAYRLVSLERPAGAAATAFVGRDDELRHLLMVYDAAVAERRARLAVVLGSPGLGKSRLLDEVGRRLGVDATVLTARCEAAGGATFAPIATALRSVLRNDDETSGAAGREPTAEASAERAQGEALHAAIAAVLSDNSERDRIAAGIAALLAGTPGSPEETFFVIRRFLAAVAITQPVLLAIDDLQWAEPLMLDLVEHLVQWGSGTPLLVLVAARPELRDSRSSLTTTGTLVSDVVTLAGLDAGAATRLAANVIGADALPAAVAGRVLATSEGNPLFVGELVRMLVDDGALKKDGGRWTTAVDLTTLSMPPTIHALLAARIERLRPEDRLVLERAAVVGRQFSRSAVAHLLTRDVRDLDARLEALRRSELIEPDTAWFLGEPALRFHHGLTRDAAYRRLLKETRADLHGRCAEWIAGKVGDTIEHDELLGWHLEQAHQHLHELGPLDAQGKALGERAARHLGAAGRRALARDDATVAADLLGRALHVLDAADPACADLALDWCEALLAAGDVGHAKVAIDELGRLIDDRFASGSLPLKKGGQEGFVDESSRQIPLGPLFSKGEGARLSAWHACFAGQLAVLTDPQTLHKTVGALAAAATALAEIRDAAGEAKAHQVHAQALQRLGSIGACEAALDKALAASRRVGDRRRSNAVLAGAPQAALWGPSPVTRASGRCLDVVRVLRITQGAPAVEAVALRCQAVLEALRGRAEAARRMITSSRQMVEELGITQQVLETDTYIGLIELLEEDAAAAERSLRPAYEGFRTHGLGIDAARAAALLGRALFIQGNAAEAEALSHESEALAGDDLQAAIAWRRVRAETLAARGEHAAAVEVARTAVQIAGATDSLLLHANARMALAAALHAAGRSAEAATEEARAIELWEAKGATLLTERARASRTKEDAPLMSPRPLGPPGDGQGDRTEHEASRFDSPHPSRRPEGEVQARVRGRVRPNAAIAHMTRMNAAFVARDLDALAALIDDHAVMVDHPHGAELDRGQALGLWRSFLDMENLRVALTPMATLGDSLALIRTSASASGVARGDIDAGPYDREEIVLVEVGAGQGQRSEFFAIDHLGDAIVRLYEVYATTLADGPVRTRAAAIARSVVALLGPPDRWPFAADAEATDHRTVGFGCVRGGEAVLQAIRALLQLSEDFTSRIDDVLALRHEGFLLRWTTSGTLRSSGGPFERNSLMLWLFGADGLLKCWEQFETDHESQALARFNLLARSTSVLIGEGEAPAEPSLPGHGSPGGSPPQMFRRPDGGATTIRRVRPNAATTSEARLIAVMAARDGDALPDLFADDFQAVHHPTGLVFDKEGNVSSLSTLLGSDTPRFEIETLATLGDSLSLSRNIVSARSATTGTLELGAFESELVVLSEVDAAQRCRHLEFFAPEHLGDAVARLYERYAELLPDGPARDRAAATAHSVAGVGGQYDVGAFSRAFAANVESVDHRILGTWSAQGAQEVLRNLRALRDLTDDFVVRDVDILALRPGAYLLRRTVTGTDRAGGGAFERIYLGLCVFGSDGLITRWEQFDADREAEALARFEELSNPCGSPLGQGRIEEGSTNPLRIPPNAATHVGDRHSEALAARDLEALGRLCAPTMIFDDRRRGVLLTGDRSTFIASNRITAGARVAHTLLATAGDRLALEHLRWTGGAIGQEWEAENLSLHEIDAEGRTIAVIAFDADDRRAASFEMQERYARSDEARCIPAAAADAIRAWNTRDLDRLRAAVADDFVLNDHRRTGVGRIEGADDYIASAAAVFEQITEETTEPLYVVAVDTHGALAMTRAFGKLLDGGDYEIVYAALALYRDGRYVGLELFEPEDLDAARARFEELRSQAAPLRPDPLRVPSNAASQARDRVHVEFEARDWVTMRRMVTGDFVYEDRRKHVLVSGDVEFWIRAMKLSRSAPQVQLRRELIGTAGDRVAVEHGLWSGAHEGGSFEIECLMLTEVDAEGRMRASINFDVDDRRPAFAEAQSRFVAGEAATVGGPAVLAAFGSASARRDWNAMRSCLARDLVVRDHSTLGLGVISGDAFVDALRAQAELAPDVGGETLRIMTWNQFGVVDVVRVFGTFPNDGGPFEKFYVRAILTAGDRIRNFEVFDIADTDQALARFEELCAEHARE